MAVGTRCRFDDNNPKYWHGCCHIRSAAVIIGTIQLICFLFEISNSAAVASRAQRLMSKYKGLPNGTSTNGQVLTSDTDNRYVDAFKTYAYSGDPFDAPYMNDYTNRVKNPSAHAADVTWHALSALAVVLMFYAIRFTRPYLMAPKFIFDAISAGLSTVGAATIMTVALGRSFTVQDTMGPPLAASMLIASVHLYFFWITMRCFKYLLEKRAFVDTALLNNDAFISLPTFGIFDLPARGAATITTQTTDHPPAYLTVVQEQPIVKPTTSKPAENDETVPPSYEEAQQLRQEQQNPPVQSVANQET